MATNNQLYSEPEILERIFDHIDNKTTDLGNTVWKEPVENYCSQERFESEIALLRRLPVVFCLSAMLPDRGSYIARKAAGTPYSWCEGMMEKFVPLSTHVGTEVCKSPQVMVVRGHLCVPTTPGPMALKANSDIFQGTPDFQVWN